MSKPYLNEEEVKNNIVVPYLQDLGFSPEEVSYENSFILRFGTRTHVVEKESRTGYLDILCRKDTKNLFILEIKREELHITQDDIDQGISYARLLNQIAPFVIVTNGKETVVVDTISKEKINRTRISSQSDFWRNNCILSTDEDLKIRYKALKNFISLSSENLTIFTKGQIESRIKPLVGGPENDNAKFIPDIYFPREGLYEEYESFLYTSTTAVFAIIADAGVGKTNAVCDLCLRTKENAFALFYNGPLIHQSLLKEVNQDFNMFFSASQSHEKALSDISTIGERFNKPLAIFVDAIDEVQIPNFKQELGNLVNALRGNRYIKICLSCKSNLWEDFLYIGGSDSYLKSSIYEPTNKAFINSKLPGVFLKPFSNDELIQIIPKYGNFFSTSGSISQIARESVTVGLYLRIYYQSFQNKQMPLDNISFDFFEAYLGYKARAGLVTKESLIEILSRVAKLILSKDSSNFYSDNAVTLNEVREVLELRPTEEIPRMLFTQNLLLRSTDGDNPIIAFYDSTIRDYILIKYCYVIDRIDQSKLIEVLPKFFRGVVGLSTITFFMENADYVKLNLIKQFFNKKKNEYILAYSKILNEYFHEIRDRFNPYTLDEIGLIIAKENMISPYALFPIKKVEIEKRVIEIDCSLFSFKNPDFISKYQVRTIHYGPLPIFTDSLERSIKVSLFEQLSEILKKGRLDESGSQILLNEKVINLVYFNLKKLGYKIKTHNNPLPNYEDIHGLHLAEIKKKIYCYFAEQYFEYQNVQDLVKSGEIVSQDGGLSYSTNQLDWNWINAQIDNAIENELEIPALRENIKSSPLAFLYNCINSLLQNGKTVLGELEYLPPINAMISKIDSSGNPTRYYFKKGSIQTIVESTLKILDSAYKDLVDLCFPSIKHELDYYSKLPHQFYIYYNNESEQFHTNFCYAYTQSENGRTNFKWIDTPWARSEFAKYGYVLLHSVRLDYLFRQNSSRDLFRSFDSRESERHLVVRELVYKILEDDFKNYCKENEIDTHHSFS